MIRTFEAEIAEKLRTSSLAEKLGVLIKERCNGLFKKMSAELLICLFVGVFCCFNHTRCINNDWKCDF